MKELDVKKIYNISDVEARDKLLAAIIIMQVIIECPNETEVNKDRMQKFIDQFTKS